jgi:cold shock CspA family protein
MIGIVHSISQKKYHGTIKGEDGKTRPFRRVGMVLWAEFESLKAGDRVRFDIEADRAINVERDLTP